ncbi:hypothetical protein [Dyella acidiphila]|uniref:Glycosyltransferase RgtA/B/C/D-like domain-containing protein n=1 Tax=Dyella acidiphila TaxID=2775866 RepID=A0ABR9GCF2_9GAMM|nr:hypothetical protein [Dyella acidiphila]MBE1161707.1 hypothetical protein [Dyella acidiphila]
MVSEFLYAWLAGLALPCALGWPLAVRLGFHEGPRALGMMAACGLSLLLIACRAVQVWYPLAAAAWYLALAYALALLVLWTAGDVRRALRQLLQQHANDLLLLGLIVAVLSLALNVPVFKGAIQFEGSRNADSFTYVSSARYMLGHAFDGVPDFSPAHPVFTIARLYFGDTAMQPRPAGEGLLAWLSAMRGVDPMYVYNGLQTAAVMLAGLSVLVFLPRRPSRGFGLLAWVMLGCPTLLFVAINSNFANGMALAAATAYVGLGLLTRRRGTFVAALLLLGCMLSAYPELIVFAGAIRAFALIGEALATRRLRWLLQELLLLLAELLLACLLLPWAAKGSWIDYLTTLHLSHAGASDQAGNMYAGLPLAAFALLLLGLSWQGWSRMPQAVRMRALGAGVLLAFALAQLLMMARGYGYGGFKISEYFVSLLAGVVVACGAVLLDGDTPSTSTRWRFAGPAALVLLALVTVWQDTRMIKRSWAFAGDRQITRDLVAMGQWMDAHAQDRLIAMGSTPTPFYYGHWLPYLTRAQMVYDWRDPDAAGFLSPYLKLAETHHYAEADLRLSIDDIAAPRAKQADDVAAFGRVHLSRR